MAVRRLALHLRQAGRLYVAGGPPYSLDGAVWGARLRIGPSALAVVPGRAGKPRSHGSVAAPGGVCLLGLAPFACPARPSLAHAQRWLASLLVVCALAALPRRASVQRCPFVLVVAALTGRASFWRRYYNLR